jgi:hypothetical protein
MSDEQNKIDELDAKVRGTEQNDTETEAHARVRGPEAVPETEAHARVRGPEAPEARVR